MICTTCGADVEAKKFCPYCGERLNAKEKRESSIHIQRAHRIPSGVTRMRKHVSVSDTALPNVQDNPREIVGEIAGNHQSGEFSSRKSLELEALLEKLNHNETDIDVKVMDVFDDEDTLFDSQPSVSEMVIDKGSLLSNPSLSTASLTDEFFSSGDEEMDVHVSGPIPVGSGSFARVPSGGFHPIVESIKNAFQGLSAKCKGLFNKSDNDDIEVYQSDAMTRKERRRFMLAAIVTAITVVVAIGMILNQNETQTTPEIAAQGSIQTNQDLDAMDMDDEDITTLTFDGDEFIIPDLDFASDDEAKVESGVAAVQKPTTDKAELAIKAAKEAASKTAKKTAQNTVTGPNTVTEIRRYDKKDNVLATISSGETVKLNKQCIMREGPASRFGLVKQIPVGTTVKILANTEEDWELQEGGVWKKAGQPAKLGPGSVFADAKPGMTVPQPKSRVISSSNWRYIQAGDVFGYVGPACFK